jgi:hypothetical protein
VTAGAASGRFRVGLRVLDEAFKLMDSLQAQHPPNSPQSSAECRVCPVCRSLAALREANPEAVSRMGRALTDLATAFGDLGAGVAEEPEAPVPRPAPPQPVRLQAIDVTD